MKLEGLLFRVTLGILTEEEKEMVKNIMEDVLALRAEIQADNRIISRMIEKFYMDIKPKNIKKENVPNVVFDEHLLKEPKNLIDETSMLLKQGPLSSKTALEIFGFSPRIELAQKKEELKDKDGYTPIVEPGQGNSIISQGNVEKALKTKNANPGSPGKPGTDKPIVKKEDNQPRPSTSEEIASILKETGYEGDMAPFKGVPAGAMKIWESVYRAAKKAGDSEAKAAKKAWGAVKNAGWKKGKDGKWTKSKK